MAGSDQAAEGTVSSPAKRGVPECQTFQGDRNGVPAKDPGGRSRIRTYDPLIKSQLLYQLSYAPLAE